MPARITVWTRKHLALPRGGRAVNGLNPNDAKVGKGLNVQIVHLASSFLIPASITESHYENNLL